MIKNHKSGMKVSSCGIIYDEFMNIKNRSVSSGYFYISHHGTIYTAHRLVAECFIENPENKKCVDHINGKKQDNRVENLRWCTRKENALYEVVKNTHRKGEGHGRSKLRWSDVLYIRKHYKCVSSRESNSKKLAKKFNVCSSSIVNAATYKTWKQKD